MLAYCSLQRPILPVDIRKSRHEAKIDKQINPIALKVGNIYISNYFIWQWQYVHNKYNTQDDS